MSQKSLGWRPVEASQAFGGFRAANLVLPRPGYDGVVAQGAALVRMWLLWVAGFFLLNAVDGLLFVDRLLYGEWEGKTGDTVSRTINLLFTGSALLLFVYGTLCGVRRLPVIGTGLAAAFLGFLLASAAWSLDPGSTIRLAIEYVFVMVGVIGLVQILDADRFMNVLMWVCFGCALASMTLRVISPGSAQLVGVAGTDFRGIFPHKNVLGQVMAIGALACLHAIRKEERGYVTKGVILAVFGGLAFFSKSTAALLLTMIFVAVSFYFTFQKKGGAARRIANIAAIVSAPILLVVAVAPDTVLELIGKDPTLTGRTEIWGYVWSYITMKPLLGWGYFGFWFAGNPAAIAISDAVHWVVPQAHNGLLELLLNIGLAGTGIALFLFVRTLVFGFRCLAGPYRDLGISTIMCCIGLVITGVSETVLLAPNQSLTTVFFVTGLLCERAERDSKRRARTVWRPEHSVGARVRTALPIARGQR